MSMSERVVEQIAKLGATAIICSIVAFLVGSLLAPFAVVWSLNTLFALGIAYSFKTWGAVLVFLGFGAFYKFL